MDYLVTDFEHENEIVDGLDNAVFELSQRYAYYQISLRDSYFVPEVSEADIEKALGFTFYPLDETGQPRKSSPMHASAQEVDYE